MTSKKRARKLKISDRNEFITDYANKTAKIAREASENIPNLRTAEYILLGLETVLNEIFTLYVENGKDSKAKGDKKQDNKEEGGTKED